MAGTHQEQVQLLTIPFDWHLSEVTNDELAILTVPHGSGMQVELLSVGFTCRVLVTGGTVDLEWRDALRDEQNATSSLATSMAAFTTSNVQPDRVLDCNSTSVAEMADVLGTIIADLKNKNVSFPNYAITNLTRALTHNSDANDAALLADQIGQLAIDLQQDRIRKVTFSNGATDRAFNADSTTTLELSDILQNLHDDLTPTADLKASVSLITGHLEDYNPIWDGALILNQGDTVNLEIAVSDSTTDGEGYAAIVEYRVLKHS